MLPGHREVLHHHLAVRLTAKDAALAGLNLVNEDVPHCLALPKHFDSHCCGGVLHFEHNCSRGVPAERQLCAMGFACCEQEGAVNLGTMLSWQSSSTVDVLWCRDHDLIVCAVRCVW